MTELNDEELVSEIAEGIIGDIDSPAKPPESKELQLFHDVYILDMEIGSGASFEQYFRWASKEQVDQILSQLVEIGLNEIVDSMRKAINIAFPNGIPDSSDEYHDCTDWSEEQEDKLAELYESEENIHALIEEKLAKYAREKKLLFAR